MKLLLALLISTSILSANFFKEEDKQAHIAVTTLVSIIATEWAYEHGYTKTEAKWIGFGTAILVGLGKETYDSRDGGTGFDMRDMGANAIGGALGTFTLIRF